MTCPLSTPLLSLCRWLYLFDYLSTPPTRRDLRHNLFNNSKIKPNREFVFIFSIFFICFLTIYLILFSCYSICPEILQPQTSISGTSFFLRRFRIRTLQNCMDPYLLGKNIKTGSGFSDGSICIRFFF